MAKSRQPTGGPHLFFVPACGTTFCHTSDANYLRIQYITLRRNSDVLRFLFVDNTYLPMTCSDTDVPLAGGRGPGRPAGRSARWADVSICPRSSRSRSPPPVFEAEPAVCFFTSAGQAQRSRSRSNSVSPPPVRFTPSPIHRAV